MRITFSFDFMRFKLFYFLISSDKQIFSSTPVMTRCGKLCPTKFFCHLFSPLIYEMRNYGNVNIQLCQRKKVFFLNFHVTTTSTKVIECTGYGGKKSTNKKIPQEVPKYAHVCIVVKFHKIFMIPQPVTP